MRISHQWCDLIARKCFEYGHEVGTTPGNGDLALFCPACPQPGINLPLNWGEDLDW